MIPILTPYLEDGGIDSGSDVWIGTGSTLVSGISIGDGAIIGAGRIVSRDVKSAPVVVGFPANVLFELEN
jgi:virginiamycin A acetyltransferase